MSFKERIKREEKVGKTSIVKVHDVKGICPPKYTKTDSRPLISPRIMGAKNFVMVHNEIELGGEIKMHEHDAEHGYFVIEGKMLLRIDDEEKEVNMDSGIYIPPKVRHGLKSIGDKKLPVFHNRQKNVIER